ncbi:tyrosine-type recombinase/integrase [Cohnella sp. JJ-181]|uniref:tyrosine-type recombinase/integrase n=1 Tax=Cohnella rhizoplanae TaxID=2974897 RepID=UPI0022FF50C5|nr:tyrosine-type recombinase/integrase [Cohnella sp. JJ-181]CAI6087240.1 Tyrosine recombinase XerC [Cohnella sp. JJ-181]
MAYVEKRSENTWRLNVVAGYRADGSKIMERRRVVVEDTALLKAPKKLREYLQEELVKFKMEVESGSYVSPEKMTFAAFVDEWREKFAKKELSARTYKNYDGHIKKHIIPHFGHMRIDQIKTMHIVTFVDELSKPGARKDGRSDTLSSSTIVFIYKVIKSIFNQAQEWRVIKDNPMEGVKKPKLEKKTMSYFTSEEAQAAIKALYTEPVMWRLFMLGAMIGGFRRGELVALTWDDVDFEAGTIRIDESISLTEGGEAIIADPKTESSAATVDMPKWYMDELKKYERLWKKNYMQVRDKWKYTDGRLYVFHAGYGKPLYFSNPSQWWKKFLARHELKPIRLHDLRHTTATLLLENDTDLKIIQERLRHSQYSTTADLYAHVTKKASRATADKFNQFDPKAGAGK